MGIRALQDYAKRDDCFMAALYGVAVSPYSKRGSAAFLGA
jgi:hypothetical protein